jgi:hypothetical protein
VERFERRPSDAEMAELTTRREVGALFVQLRSTSRRRAS